MKKIALVLGLVLLFVTVLTACQAEAPVAQFKASPLVGRAPLEVAFTDLSQGEIDTWEWDFDNDGTVDSTLQNPMHTYTLPGIYTATLIVMGPGGIDSEMKLAYLECVPEPCHTSFVATPTEGSGSTTVKFTDQSTGEVTIWQWDLNGDGKVDSTAQNPSYTYTRNGRYTITLTIQGPFCEDTLTKKDYIYITGCKT